MRKKLFLLICVILAGCITVPVMFTGCGTTRVDSPFQHEMDSLGVTSSRLRAKNIDLAVRIGLILESASDSIIGQSEDANIRQNARQWKSYALPGIRQALSFNDPVAATADGWAFAIQHRNYLTSGKGKTMFGPQQRIAVQAAEDIEMLFVREQPFEEGTESLRTIIRDWAEKHPIENASFQRESMISSMKALRIEPDRSTLSSVGEIANDVRDISNRLSLYTAQLPREIRWQGEYLLEELRVEDRLDSLNILVSTMVEAVDRLTSTINGGDLVVDVHGLRELRGDILSLKQQISTERELLLADVNRQRLETLREVERLSRELMTGVKNPALEIVDYVLFRLMIGAAVVMVVAVAIVLLMRRRTA